MPVRLNLNIPDDLHEQLKRVSEQEDRTMTQVLCRALRAFFATIQETETKPAPRTRKDQS
jgi:predicted transcriptional regulator